MSNVEHLLSCCVSFEALTAQSGSACWWFNVKQNNCRQQPEQTVLPHISNRTLHHPSFVSLYVHAGRLPHQGGSPTVHPIIPSEVFYIDPTMGCRRRIPNILTGMRAFDRSQLNTPRPIMSACLAPPNCPDPFRWGPQPTRDLGSPTWRTHTKYPQVHPEWVILQLTEEEDQAVTNLLKLHHQKVPQTDDISAAHMDLANDLEDPQSAEAANKQISAGDQYLRELQHRRGWSEMELEATETLSGFNQEEEDLIRTLNRCQSPASPLLCQSAGAQDECETLSTLVTCACTKDGSHSTYFSCDGENGEVWSEENRAGCQSCGKCLENKLASPSSPSLNSKMRSRSEELMHTDLEGDAVHVLLSLKDVVTFDILQ